MYGCSPRSTLPEAFFSLNRCTIFLSTASRTNDGLVIITAEPQEDVDLNYLHHIYGQVHACCLSGQNMASEFVMARANWQKQCDALSDVLRGDLGLCHLWKYLLTCNTILSIVGGHVLIL